LNYFNYFTEIEDAFVRRRGKHLLLSPMDWALIESWKEMKVPLHVALRGIEKSFDSWESKPRRRTVKSLLYCQEEVEAQYAEWLDAHVGTAAESESDDSASREPENAGLPFPRAAILEHLERCRAGLFAALQKLSNSSAGDLVEALERGAAQLSELQDDFAATTLPDVQKLEQSLTGVERMLTDAILSVVSSDQLDVLTQEVEKQLKPYRKQMEPAVYEQTRNNLLLKRLRETFNVPRLSLFYL
jgi:CHAT domain-containing protein